MPTPSLVKHLRYEVQMLGDTWAKISARDFDGQTAQNALIESFCIHARNLNEFFVEESKWADTLKASSFVDAGYKRPRSTKRRKALFSKINKQIAHLTKNRTSVARHKIGEKQMLDMFVLLYRDLVNFDGHIRPKLRRKWKVVFAGH